MTTNTKRADGKESSRAIGEASAEIPKQQFKMSMLTIRRTVASAESKATRRQGDSRSRS